MNFNKYIITSILFLISLTSFTQVKYLEGTVLTEHEHHHEGEENTTHETPLENVTVYWLGTTIGTITNKNGDFQLQKPENKNLQLIVSFIGYKSDTITINPNQTSINVVLEEQEDFHLNEVVVTERRSSGFIPILKTEKTQVITQRGLETLACCNLSESFESNATVDVSYADAVTGAKQIQMLGLVGVYSQILTENMPLIRGLGHTYGLGFIPGSWMESIQISKGTASVINGYESTTGQINIEYKKPENSERLFLNLYGNHFGKTEGNLVSAIELNPNISTMVYVHGENHSEIIDNNNDGFLDIPKSSQINFFNRWKFSSSEQMHSQLGIKVLNEKRLGGQETWFNSGRPDNAGYYGLEINTEHYEVFTKNGFILNETTQNSIGLIISGTIHKQDSYFGNNTYNGKQENLYGNLIYQTILGNTSHKLSTGISYLYDKYDETFNDTSFIRKELVPGVFSQYTYDYLDKFTFIAGLRADKHNLYGTFLTPRLHFRYNISENTVFRGSAGKGYRVANIFAEHTGLMASSREFIFNERLNAEEAWNYGLNFTQYFNINSNRATFSIDLYRTDFINKVVANIDRNSTEVYFYNLDGESFSNSFQAELNFEPLNRLDITAAFRLNDVKMTIDNNLVQKPMVKKQKGLFTISYSTRNNSWNFNITNQFNGKGRLPDTSTNPDIYRLEEYSPHHVIIHAQITKTIKAWEFYIGGENLTNYKQKNPIIAADDPFGDYFDTSVVWGPIAGIMGYIGLRYSLP